MSAREILRNIIDSKERWIVVFAKGHSGTRSISKTLIDSGVYMGKQHNGAWDKQPFRHIYNAARMAGQCVQATGSENWDFSRLWNDPIPEAACEELIAYLHDLQKHPDPVVGWKLPETVLLYPWIVRLFGDRLYAIYWVRDPRDATLGSHGTDDLSQWGLEGFGTGCSVMEKRWRSWKYQIDIWSDTPKEFQPKNWLLLRAEDLNSPHQRPSVRDELSTFIGRAANLVPPRGESVGRWRRCKGGPSGLSDGVQHQPGQLRDRPNWLDRYLWLLEYQV